jgi:hypothetical protein
MHGFLHFGQILLFPNDDTDDVDDILGGVSTDQ